MSTIPTSEIQVNSECGKTIINIDTKPVSLLHFANIPPRSNVIDEKRTQQVQQCSQQKNNKTIEVQCLITFRRTLYKNGAAHVCREEEMQGTYLTEFQNVFGKEMSNGKFILANINDDCSFSVFCQSAYDWLNKTHLSLLSFLLHNYPLY